MLFRLILIMALCLWANAQAYAEPPTLHRGINLSNWLANAERQKVTENDFRQIAAAGFDHIRLPVNPARMGFDLDNAPDNLKFAEVDDALHLATKHKLCVILDIHPPQKFMDQLEQSSEAEEHFIQFWDRLARHYDAQHYPDMVFSLLNEPHYYHAENHYRDFMQKLITQIRQSSPDRIIVMSSPHGAALDALTDMRPMDDEHIIYEFHFYEPYIITHQGIYRGFEKKAIRFFHDLPYPADLATADANHYATPYTEGAIDPYLAERDLREYKTQNWNAQYIAERINLARTWADKYHARLLCGEFGVLRTHIDAASRYRWITDTRAALDTNNISWDLWDYSDLMGIVRYEGATSPPDPVDGSTHLLTPTKGRHVIEGEAVGALGLEKNAHP